MFNCPTSHLSSRASSSTIQPSHETLHSHRMVLPPGQWAAVARMDQPDTNTNSSSPMLSCWPTAWLCYMTRTSPPLDDIPSGFSCTATGWNPNQNTISQSLLKLHTHLWFTSGFVHPLFAGFAQKKCSSSSWQKIKTSSSALTANTFSPLIKLECIPSALSYRLEPTWAQEREPTTESSPALSWSMIAMATNAT